MIFDSSGPIQKLPSQVPKWIERHCYKLRLRAGPMVSTSYFGDHHNSRPICDHCQTPNSAQRNAFPLFKLATILQVNTSRLSNPSPSISPNRYNICCRYIYIYVCIYIYIYVCIYSYSYIVIVVSYIMTA